MRSSVVVKLGGLWEGLAVGGRVVRGRIGRALGGLSGGRGVGVSGSWGVRGCS